MVSANPSGHTSLAEMNSFTSTAAYLIERGSEPMEAGWHAYEARKKALMTELSLAET